MEDYRKRAEELEDTVIEWYQWLHRHPELGYREQETADFIAAQLSAMDGIEVTRPCETGVLGILRGVRPGRIVAFRADIDALPIEELAEVPYRSEHPGVMHACGHDGHAAMLLGAAKILSGMRRELAGEIRFLFQPAEEVQPGGSNQMIRGGAVDGANLIFGAHLDVLHPVNSFGLLAGPLMASTASFEIEIEGKGGHAAFPYQTVDTVYIAAKVIESVQGVVTRNVSATNRAIVTITQMQGSTASNIIPAKVTLGGTLRVLDEECEEIIRKRLAEVVEGTCSTWGAVGKITFSEGQNALINPRKLLHQVEASIWKCPGAVVYEDQPVLGGEDFASYLKKVPGFYYKVGAKPEHTEVYPHHNARFVINQKALAKGVAVCVSVLLDATGTVSGEE
ncbi:MAG: amidohydrolase [Eubacteriales bacterium]|nr:amidohydrolase [Eubacteriales bacterium]